MSHKNQTFAKMEEDRRLVFNVVPNLSSVVFQPSIFAFFAVFHCRSWKPDDFLKVDRDLVLSV